MSNYTLQLRHYIENGGQVFDFDYPLFDPAYKSVLEKKILDYYYFREIGLETIGQFKWFLRSKLNRIMPLYNEMYQQNEVFKTYDPYKNKNVTTTDKRTSTSNQTGKSESSSSGTSTDVFSDTPQARLAGKDYATNLTESDTGGTGSVISDGTVTTTDDYVTTTVGHDGMRYPSDILIDLRKMLINIDQMIIDECAELFLNIA
jgi:hypothetical protein